MKAIDLFAGAGGFSTGARMAGVEVVWAANHWPTAVETHARNHPDTAHVCQDLHQADWSKVPAHDILLASPCCQGHSRARGKAANNPQHDASRSTAWAVVSALEYHRPPFAVIENVKEFMQWKLFPAWRLAMQALGYELAPHLIDAADHGVPQHRERLFLVASRSERPMMLRLPQRDHVPAAKVVDFEAGSWSPVQKPGRAASTLQRIAQGRRAHGDRFLTAYYGNEAGGRSLARPLGTVTTRDRYALIDGDRMRMLRADEYRAAMGFPADYRLPEQHRTAVHLLGNAVCPPVARDVITAIREAA
ncbi:DNA cytosine methyltransferase [Cupriavidus gilardii]|uniref:DNA (cytosine-5-)-methyltransferase n=1 Tax=Cupriavidus gilardii TaxID=82541 RepID=A0ABY4VPK8_9BURK|nr:DNA cytosine methyltransferase [Cupriavidus gilardii]USE78950.1 DNA cytosine methyltransferase [Cupriavidus gilardii]UXC38235.1 DNA cytosine methyltransferase [Cupriavidus gilardii]